MEKLFSLLILVNISYAQNLDSLYNELMNRSSKPSSISQIQIENDGRNKCEFGLRATVRQHIDEFSYDQRQSIEEILSRPSLQTSIISPSGIFRIHYDTSGYNAPLYDVNELAVAFDSAYSYEVSLLGYPPPPSDGVLGGDNKYDIYIRHLSGGLYGTTTPEDNIGGDKYLSYIEIDNSFTKNEGYNTYGINAAKVTAAHEFHHAIQIGNYIYRTADSFYYELTSTALEEFVFDEVNDYYAYMSSFFNQPSKKFQDNSGYNLAVWNIFLRERFAGATPNIGDKIIKRSWENLVQDRAIIAIAKAINEYGYSFSREFNNFGTWLYFTKYRAKQNKYFEEAKFYPLVKPTITSQINSVEKTFTISCEPTTVNYLMFTENKNSGTDTLSAVLSNSDIYAATINGNATNLDFTISNYSFTGSTAINEFYFSKLSGSSIEYINSSYIYNNELTGGNNSLSEISSAYPQPFDFTNNSIIFIPTYKDESGSAELNIYSSDMNLVYSGFKNILLSENVVVTWDGLKNNGERASSGVYIFVTKADDKIKKGKFVVFN